MDQDAHMRRIIDNLSTDLNNLSSESKRKYASVKEACESSLLKLRQINSLKSNLYKTMCDTSADIIKPFILGCETKQSKIIQICLTSVQKVIEAKILNVNSASILINTLWQLTENSQEELKVLQTIILLVTTTDVVKHQYLAKTLTIGLRITSSKDQIVVNTATAMLSQMVTKVFERVVAENKLAKQTAAPLSSEPHQLRPADIDQLKLLSKEAPAWMNECAQDAYMLLQDIYLLLNSDHALWLIGITDINKPFGLELLKSVLVRYAEIFTVNPEMSFVLKERICPLLIKLFSPTSKNKGNSTGGSSSSSASTSNNGDQKTFAVVSRLIRIVFILVKNYFELLVTENEIFLSLLTKFLDVERPIWQKALAIEAFHKISVESRLIRLLVVNYDMKQHPEKIFSLITNGIALFIQSLFLNAATTSTGSSSSSGVSMSGSSMLQSNSSQLSQSGSSSISSSMMNSSQTSLASAGGSQLGGGFAFQISSAQPSFIYKDTTIQLLFPYISGQVKSLFLDGWDKIEIPYIQDGYLLSIGFSTLQELCKSVQSLIDQNLIQFQQEEAEKASMASNPSAINSTVLSGTSASTSQLVNYKKLNLNEQQCQQSPYLNECIQLMNACSNNFLFVYNILLESSLDESITDQIIKSVRTLIYICATLNLHAQRDAFVTLMCKAALPSSYAHNVLNLKSLTDLSYLIMQQQQAGGAQQYQAPVYNPRQNKTNTAYDDSSEKQIQVVAIGPALHLAGANSTNQPNSSSPHHQSTLCITAKNLLTMKSILNMSHLYAELLGSSWYIVLNTLQHLTWTLGLKPTTGSNGQLKHLNNSILPPGSTAQSASSSTTQNSSNQSSSSNASLQLGSNPDNNSMITTAIQTEIAFICNMLTKLFESTRTISEQALDDIVDSLLKLSIECSDLAYVRPEPCLFPLAKLFEASIANLNRIELFWQKVTMHFLCSCKHSNIKYREWCVDYICSLIRTTFNHKFTSSDNETAIISSGMSSGTSGAEMRDIILKPLHELSSISYNDIRQKQIECTLTILRLTGPSLGDAWPLCLGIIGAIQPTHTDSLIRSAFQCLQLVVTDFLSTIRPRYLSLVIRVVAKFGSQEQDLNIALTAVVLLWNISDYMFQNSERLSDELKKQRDALKNENEEFDENKYLLNDEPPALKTLDDSESFTCSPYNIESIWMVLYSRLGQLCVDSRPAVRKSACQTLFCTISSHGSILNSADSSLTHWRQLVWRVLFPLLEQVRHLTRTASRERDKPNTPNFLMHHSRDTAEKQWAETSVLTLAGVTRVFNSKYSMLATGLTQQEFHRMWLFLLEIIQSLGLSRNSEIAQASLRGFHELLGNQNYFSSAASFVGTSASAAQTVAAAAAAASAVTNINGTTPQQQANNVNGSGSNHSMKKKDSENNTNGSSTSAAITKESPVASKTLEINEWLAAWKTWLDIGNHLLSNSPNSSTNGPVNSELMTIYCWPPPGQTFLTCYVDLVSVIVDKLAPAGRFTIKDFENFSQIIDKLLAVPVLSSDYSSFILMQSESNLSPLQNSCLNTIKNFIKLLKTTDASFHNQFISPVFHRLLAFVLFACYNTSNTSSMHNSTNQNSDSRSSGGRGNEIVAVNSVVFGEKALVIVTNLYEETASNEAVIENLILKTIIQTLYVPLSLKYSCPSPTTWKLSIECLFKILKKALPIAQKNKSSFETMWLDLAKTFEDFLFTKNTGSPDLSLDQVQKDEVIDCQLVELIRDDMLVHSASLPPQFIQKILAILNRGSIYSTSNFESFIDLDSTKKLREEFSKTCFETLLRFSFVNESNSNAASGDGLTRMALASMLSRCKEIVQRYAHDERLNGNVPLPRTNEMIGVLKAVCTLINALKKAPKESVQATIWYQVIGLYPSLVECTTSPSPLVSSAVKETLHHYFAFLRAPNS